MSKAQLKKTLAKMSAESIAEVLYELYDARPEAKEYLEFWLNPDQKSELEKYKLKIHRLFFTPAGKLRKRPTITSIKKELKYFSSICFEPEIVSELYLYLCNTDLQWLKERKNPAPSLKSVRGNIELMRQYIEKAGLESQFQLRMNRIEELYNEEKQRSEQRSGYGWRRWRW